MMTSGRKQLGQRQPSSGISCKGNKMRIAAGLIFASAVSLCASGAAWSQTPATKGAATPQATPAPAPAAAPKSATAPQAAPAPARAPAPIKAACANPNALGIARVVEIDTTG